MPIEVIGLLVGKPEGDTLVILDATPLPVEGGEAWVAPPESVLALMTSLQDAMEEKRKERFVGWYHSHPFDVDSLSKCFMSATDVQTQTVWQMQLPIWVAIVVDPLRSLAKQEPHFGAFRTYPPTYSPPPNQGPDGATGDKEELQIRWAALYHRYYQLEISFFMSSLGHRLLGIMSKNNLWVRVLSSTSMLETENRDRFPERLSKASSKLEQAGRSEGAYGGRWGHHGGRKGKETSALAQGAVACGELAIEQCKGHAGQIVKDILFNLGEASARRAGGTAAAAAAVEHKADDRKAT